MLASPASPGRAESAAASTAPAGAPPYRPDIDGLRALAVLAVIFFHAGFPGFAGGYVGVDVFFVVSGYLITQLLSVPRPGGTTRRLGDFYVRRARRILPALLLTCAVVALLGWLLLLPGELVFLGKHLSAAAVFLSNLSGWHEGYFTQGLVQPLRHLWSIAVEEQFYLFYPLLLLLVTRYLPRRRSEALLYLALGSLLLCIWASQAHPAVNYFAAPTRAWQLLLGALLYTAGVGPLRLRVANECLAAVALAVLAACVSLYVPGRVPYPGIYALAPCAATAVLLATGSGGRTRVARVLSWRPLVFVGLISYSLYLWHWPLLVFASYYHVTPLSAGMRGAVLLASAALAVLSWCLVEQPVRRRRVLPDTRSLGIAAILASAAIGIVGVLLWLSDGFPLRLEPSVRALLEPSYAGPLTVCTEKPLTEIAAGAWCAFGDASPGARAVLVWGDSHALALMPAYEQLAREHGTRLYLAARGGCLPLIDVDNTRHDAASGRACAAFNDAVIRGIGVVQPATVVLTARWQDGRLAAAAGAHAQAAESAFTFGLRRTLAAAGRDVCVVLDVPTLKYDGVYALAMARRRQMTDDFVAVSARESRAALAPVEGDVRALASAGLVRYADPKDVLCPGEPCLYKHDGHSLYYDSDHLSARGALFVRSALESCFAPPRH